MQKLFSDDKALIRKYGDRQAGKIIQRIDDLKSVATLAQISTFGATRCEELHGDRQGQLSVRLFGGQRLIFEPANDPVPTKPDGGLDWTLVSDIRILEVVDYHG